MLQQNNYRNGNVFGFHAALAESDSHDELISQALSRVFGQFTRKITKNHVEGNDGGTDWIVEVIGGRQYRVDAKVRKDDWLQKGCDDVILEILSNCERGKVGWTGDHTKNTSVVLWVWTSTNRYAAIPFRMLLEAWDDEDNRRTWCNNPRITQFTKTNWGGYHSQGVAVDREDITRAVQQRHPDAKVWAEGYVK